MINALAENKHLPKNVSDCDDTRVMIEWLNERPGTIDIGAAGTAMRFSTALLTIMEGTHVITGSQRMLQRPIGVLVDALRQLGADIEYLEKNGFPPLKIKGKKGLEGGAICLRGDVSSQYVSALLMIAPYMNNGLKINLQGQVISRPYIDLTLNIMRCFGAVAEWEGENSVKVTDKPYVPREFTVENDWSASSYWYEFVALNQGQCTITMKGLKPDSWQGDAQVAKIFRMIGVETQFITLTDGSTAARIANSLKAVEKMEYDFVNQPDLAQTLTVTCCMKGIPFHFKGLQSLRIKETDRLTALRTELAKLGFKIEEHNGSELIWDGNRRQLTNSQLDEVAIETYDDHRMAMSFAPTALTLKSININNPEVVSKSYPNFWEEMKNAGFVIIK